MSRLTRDGTAELDSRDQILRRERGQGNIPFPCSADHEQDWQPYAVDPYSCYIHTYTECSNKVYNIILDLQTADEICKIQLCSGKHFTEFEAKIMSRNRNILGIR